MAHAIQYRENDFCFIHDAVKDDWSGLNSDDQNIDDFVVSINRKKNTTYI